MDTETAHWLKRKLASYFTAHKMWSYWRRHGTRASLKRSVPFFVQLYHEAAFDFRYGVKTRTIVPVEDLGTQAPGLDSAYRYRPSHVYSVNGALDLLRAHLPIGQDETFVDYGCGAGRVMILAAEAGFGKVTGIEFSPRMAALCRKNLETYARRRARSTEFRLVEGDAVEFDVFDDARVFFFYSPFEWDIYEKVLAKLEASCRARPRDIFILEVTARNRRNFASREYPRIDSFTDMTGELVDIYKLCPAKVGAAVERGPSLTGPNHRMCPEEHE